MLLVFALVGPFSSSSSYNTATHSPIKQVQFRCVGTSIAHPFFVSIYLSIYLPFFEARSFVVCLLVSKGNKASKLIFQRKFALLIDFFFLLPPKFWVLRGFFFPKTLEKFFVVSLCFFALLVWGMLMSYK